MFVIPTNLVSVSLLSIKIPDPNFDVHKGFFLRVLIAGVEDSNQKQL